MRRSSYLATILAGVAAFGIAACGADSSGSGNGGSSSNGTPDPDVSTPSAELSGGGSTFDQPLFTTAFFHYGQLNPKVTVSYAAIGSGKGITQFQAQSLDFGATDVPMSATDLAAAKGGDVAQVPVTLGGVTISYNVSGVSTGLKLTGDVLARIFMGQITKWNDSAITSLNSGVNLPDQSITVVHRSDGSGTTYIFTDYLSAISPAWLSGPGKGKTVKSWPTGLGGNGNAGVAGLVKQTAGSIGYVELAYALQNKFTYAAIKNASGNFVQPSLSTVAADAAAKPNVTASDFSIVNQTGAQAYPISGYSWVLIYKKQSDSDKGTALVRLFDWVTHSGQSDAKGLDYVPLPSGIQQLARTALQQVTDSNGKTLLT